MIRATRRRLILNGLNSFGAEEGTRTPTPLRVRGPEPRASANSATSARYTGQAGSARPAALSSLANAAVCVNLRPLKLFRDTGVVNPGARIGQCLNQLRVQRNLSVVGEELGDGAARLGVAGSLVERF